jgi:hypothetical protein
VLGAGPWAVAATQVGRLGLRSLTIASPNRPASERLAQHVAAGIAMYPSSLDDPRLPQAIADADLILHCGGGATLDPRLLGPAHTLVEVAAETSLAVAVERAGGHVVPHAAIVHERLVAQLHHIMGLRLDLSALDRA